MRNPERSNDRSDFSSDAAYANFREITAGNIGPGLLYRSSSPINNDINRADYAAEKMEEAGVRTVVNLSDSYKKAEDYLQKSGNEYYGKLYEEGNVTCLNLSYEFASPEFNEGIVDAVEFMSLHEPPYLIHCTEGKDRTGFLAVVLEALMGASDSEMTSDYMLTYKNFYNFDKDSNEFEYAKKNYLKEIFMDLSGVDNKKELKHLDYHQATLDFLRDGGVTEEQIQTVIEKLEDKTSNYTQIPSFAVSATDIDEKGRAELPLQEGIRAVYDGKPVKPGKNTIVVNGVYMYNGRDYKVTYKDNEHSGMMKMVITFMKRTDVYDEGIKKVSLPVYINPQRVNEENILIKMEKDRSGIRFIKDRNRDEHIKKKYFIESSSRGRVVFKGDYIGSLPLPN
jgi:protein tyrosine/serine phosphatase